MRKVVMNSVVECIHMRRVVMNCVVECIHLSEEGCYELCGGVHSFI